MGGKVQLFVVLAAHSAPDRGVPVELAGRQPGTGAADVTAVTSTLGELIAHFISLAIQSVTCGPAPVVLVRAVASQAAPPSLECECSL